MRFTSNARLYDSITLDAIPADALAVAGYVDGKWPTFGEVVRRWPRACHISIATNAAHVADILDVEAGDARIDQVVAWLELAHSGGVERPGLYASVSRMQKILDVAHAGGWRRPRVKVWTAHWTGIAHVCSPACGYGLTTHAGATQWHGAGQGHNFDTSEATPTFLNT